MELSNCPLCDSNLIAFFVTNFKNKKFIFYKCSNNFII